MINQDFNDSESKHPIQKRIFYKQKSTAIQFPDKIEDIDAVGFGGSARCIQKIKCFPELDLKSKGLAILTDIQGIHIPFPNSSSR